MRYLLLLCALFSCGAFAGDTDDLVKEAQFEKDHGYRRDPEVQWAREREDTERYIERSIAAGLASPRYRRSSPPP